MVEIKRASYDNLEGIMSVIESGREYLAKQNIDQWQDNYPNIEVIKNDLDNVEAYILADGDNVAGYFTFCAPPEPQYEVIDDGKWLNDTDNYASMHHVVISSAYRGKGLAHKIYRFCENRARECGYLSLRVDTHSDNKIMRHTAEKNGFAFCGTVYYYGILKRIAFEKLLEK